MFHNQNLFIVGGNVARPQLSQSGCLKFGLCQTASVLEGDKYIDHDNWFNVVLTKKQSEVWSTRIAQGDEVEIQGEVRIGDYNGSKTVTIFCKKINDHKPSVLRHLCSLFYKAAKEHNEPLLALMRDKQSLTALFAQIYPPQTQPAQQTVVAQPAQQTVVAQPAQQTVVAQPAQQTVVAQPAQQTVVAQPAQQTVAAQPAQQTVVAQPAQQTVVVQPAQQTVVAQPAQQTVVAQPAQQTVVAQPAQQTVAAQPAQQPVASTADQLTPEVLAAAVALLQNQPAATAQPVAAQPETAQPAEITNPAQSAPSGTAEEQIQAIAASLKPGEFSNASSYFSESTQ